MEEPIWFDAIINLLKLYPETWIIIVSLLIGTLQLFRGLSTLLEIFVDKTKTKIDNKLLSGLRHMINLLSKLCAWIGLKN